MTGSSPGVARRGSAAPGLTAARRAPDPDFLTYRVVIYTDGSGATVARQVDVADNGDWQARQNLHVYKRHAECRLWGGANGLVCDSGSSRKIRCVKAGSINIRTWKRTCLGPSDTSAPSFNGATSLLHCIAEHVPYARMMLRCHIQQ